MLLPKWILFNGSISSLSTFYHNCLHPGPFPSVSCSMQSELLHSGEEGTDAVFLAPNSAWVLKDIICWNIDGIYLHSDCWEKKGTQIQNIKKEKEKEEVKNEEEELKEEGMQEAGGKRGWRSKGGGRWVRGSMRDGKGRGYISAISKNHIGKKRLMLTNVGVGTRCFLCSNIYKTSSKEFSCVSCRWKGLVIFK